MKFRQACRPIVATIGRRFRSNSPRLKTTYETPNVLIVRRTSDNQVWLGWPPVREAAGYDVFRNGALIAWTPYAGFVDDPAPGFYEYSVIAYTQDEDHRYVPLSGLIVVAKHALEAEIHPMFQT